jgi:hypothetical protein
MVEPGAGQRAVDVLARDEDPAAGLKTRRDERPQRFELDQPERRRGVVAGAHAERVGDRAAVDRLGDRGLGASLVVQPLPRLAPEVLHLAEAVELQVNGRYLPQRARAAPVTVEERAGVVARALAHDWGRQHRHDTGEQPAHEHRAVAREIGLAGRAVGGDRAAQLVDRGAQPGRGDARAPGHHLLHDAGDDVGLGVVPGARDGDVDRPVQRCGGNRDAVCHGGALQLARCPRKSQFEPLLIPAASVFGPGCLRPSPPTVVFLGWYRLRRGRSRTDPSSQSWPCQYSTR